MAAPPADGPGAAGGHPSGVAAQAEGPVPAETLARIVVRPIASPLALGQFALAGASFVVSGVQLGWVPDRQKPAVGLVLMAFTAMTQLLASILGFLGRDPVVGTGMGLLSGTWLAVGAVLYTNPASQPTSGALGLLLLASGTALLSPATAALHSKALAGIVLYTTALHFFVTAGYELTASATWKLVSAAVGLALFVLAALAALAFELEDVRARPSRFTLRRHAGVTALAGDLTAELSGLQHEAGVRKQL